MKRSSNKKLNMSALLLAALLAAALLCGCDEAGLDALAGSAQQAQTDAPVTAAETEAAPASETDAADTDEDGQAAAPQEFTAESLEYTRALQNDEGTVTAALSAHYPEFSGGDSAAIATLNQGIAEEAAAVLDGWYAAWEEELLSGFMPQNVPYSYTAEWERSFDNGGIVSYCVTGVVDCGGAHPSTEVYGHTFDLNAGSELAITDVLTLTQVQINELLAVEFEGRIDEFPDEYYPETPELLRAGEIDWAWYLTDTGLHFVLPEYSAAPYAAGMPEYELTYADNAGVFAPYLGLAE